MKLRQFVWNYGLMGLVALALLAACTIQPVQLSGTSSTAPLGESYQVVVPPHSGNGVCSSGDVTAFSYTVTASAPGLYAVLATSKPAYDALLPANLNDPSSASLPAPLLDMSCVGYGTTTCTKTFPANRKLKPQVMCILLKGEPPIQGTRVPLGTPRPHSEPIQAQIDVTWVYATPTP